MSQDNASFTFLHRIEEVELNIEDGRWQSALALVLTLPDICGGIAFPEIVKRLPYGKHLGHGVLYRVHRNLTSAGYSASSVEKYHYPPDCHRRNRGNLLLIPGVLAVLQCKSLGVPDKVAKIIRNIVLVNDLFSCQSISERLPFSWFGINPFTCLKWESVFGGCFSKIS